jgi:hypothetical protein
MSRAIRIATLLALTFFGLNYAWTHAALANFSAEPCPSTLVSNAQTRLQAFVGNVQSAPWIICQQKPALGLNVSHGTTRFAPLLPSLVVLGPSGVNSDVLAHEWMHAEIAARTSALLRTYRMPTWFDEGLAMQLDDRADYGEAALRSYRDAGWLSRKSLDGIASPSQFFRAGEEGKSHYAFAKCVVGQWLAASGSGAAKKLLDDVSWRSSFPSEQFERHAAECLR